jgi:hypothetical protein
MLARRFDAALDKIASARSSARIIVRPRFAANTVSRSGRGCAVTGAEVAATLAEEEASEDDVTSVRVVEERQ